MHRGRSPASLRLALRLAARSGFSQARNLPSDAIAGVKVVAGLRRRAEVRPGCVHSPSALKGPHRRAPRAIARIASARCAIGFSLRSNLPSDANATPPVVAWLLYRLRSACRGGRVLEAARSFSPGGSRRRARWCGRWYRIGSLDDRTLAGSVLPLGAISAVKGVAEVGRGWLARPLFGAGGSLSVCAGGGLLLLGAIGGFWRGARGADWEEGRSWRVGCVRTGGGLT
ncbi:hypothetical protein BZB76_3559 [Actinomadura pelletieri DSM 43383]|uniref:Uncharacterized protein n=1 Tax=Actinomadura pelletieri DSM 43383 TaxID=1120940 RepID=A0A495QPX3_9ACTN|nr:hypothetical protein BZB76_3559 [Actinomadura pelletieri DSM 43383]